jgi:hypothetical protein
MTEVATLIQTRFQTQLLSHHALHDELFKRINVIYPSEVGLFLNMPFHHNIGHDGLQRPQTTNTLLITPRLGILGSPARIHEIRSCIEENYQTAMTSITYAGNGSLQLFVRFEDVLRAHQAMCRLAPVETDFYCEYIDGYLSYQFILRQN